MAQNKQKLKLLQWEVWPFNVIYFPISFVWLYYCIRSKSFWFFTSSNPTITFGGLEGEAKTEMYNQLPKHLYPSTFVVNPKDSFESILKRIEVFRIQLPFVVKPEVAGAGILFRKINTLEQLQEYHNKVKIDFIVQSLICYPKEVSVFYYRHPNADKGIITGFLEKIPMHVIGDGDSTLEQLINAHPKASRRIEEMRRIHSSCYKVVIPKGEKYFLSYAANHNRGAQFVNLKEQIDDNLIKIFDELSFKVKGWYYGRYDLMCKSIEDLKKGCNFSVIEYNGCGAEPNHIYDSGYTLMAAYKEILKHWKALFHISRCNVKNGSEYWSFMKGYRFLKSSRKHYKAMRKMEKELSF